MQDQVIVVDLDTTMSRNVARRLRAEHIYCRIVPGNVSADALLQAEPRGVLLVGGGAGQAADVPAVLDYLQCGLPLLCIGDAALALCTALGGTLTALQESGLTSVELDMEDVLMQDQEGGEKFLTSYRLMQLPEDKAVSIAHRVPGEFDDPDSLVQEGSLAFRVNQRDVWGVALPLDRNDPAATQLLLSFCRDVCGCTQWWTQRAFIEDACAALTEAAGEGEALCALSGGVDSGVCALLGQLALGERLHCLFVDTGLLRLGEADSVMAFYADQAGLNVTRINAQEDFLAALDGVYAPADKEKVINRLLKEILRREAAQHPKATLLIRGTNFSDDPVSEESPLEEMRFIEPVRALFKDEIRRIGSTLGMPQDMLQKQPFPGTGLATRILSGVTATGLTLLRHADDLFRREIEEAGLQKRLWQYFATLALSPIPNGGYLVILRAVQSSDGGGGMAARLPFDLMERVSAAILRECPGVQRVFYDLSPSQTYLQQAGN